MDTKRSEEKIEKKTWTKPKLIVYGEVQKLTTEKFGGTSNIR